MLEDDAELAGLLCDVYRLLGARCVAMTSLDQLRTSPKVLDADLVILDINLGDGASGVDAWQWLRQSRFAGRIAFLTGHAVTNPLVKNAAELSAAPILNKPVSLHTLERLLGPNADEQVAARDV